MEIRSNDVDELYRTAIESVLESDSIVSPRSKQTREIISGKLVLEPQSELPVIKNEARKLNYAFQIIEAVQYLDGSMDADRICWYNENYRSYMNENTGTFDGAYGPRIKGSLKYCFELLKRDPDSRQAVVAIFRNDLDHKESKDIACTLNLQFLLRNGMLDLIVNMRSNDVLWGTPYDIMGFTFLQHVLASWLHVKPGTYYHHAGSLHAYEDTIEKLERTYECVELFSHVSYGQFKLDPLVTEKAIESFWYFEQKSRTGEQLYFTETSFPQPFNNFLKIIHRFNEKKHGKIRH